MDLPDDDFFVVRYALPMEWAWRRWLVQYRRTRLQRLDERALERASGHLGRGCGARWLFAVPLRFAERKLRLGDR